VLLAVGRMEEYRSSCSWGGASSTGWRSAVGRGVVQGRELQAMETIIGLVLVWFVASPVLAVLVGRGIAGVEAVRIGSKPRRPEIPLRA
jgi:hypothetical protein